MTRAELPTLPDTRERPGDWMQTASGRALAAARAKLAKVEAVIAALPRCTIFADGDCSECGAVAFWINTHGEELRAALSDPPANEK